MLNVNGSLRFLFFALGTGLAFTQTAPAPDILILVDGEKLIGHLRSASDSKVVFASDIAGEVTIPWIKVQELHSNAKFAAIPKNVTLKSSADSALAPQGTLDMTAQKLEVSAAPAAPKTIPIENVSNIVPEASFDRAFRHQGFFEGWKGSTGAGLSLTRSTTDARTITAFVNLARLDPSESWFAPRNRTAVDFNLVAGKTSSDGVTSSTFSIFQSNAVREFYVAPKWFLFTGANWEHNSNQGLDLMQSYGGGVGRTFYKSERAEWSGRAGLGYVHQGFSDPTRDLNIIGSRFNQTFTYRFPRGIFFTESGGFRPAWNHSRAYVAGYVASLSVPLYKRFDVSLNSFDSYVNNPPAYFKQNTLQLTINIGYSFK